LQISANAKLRNRTNKPRSRILPASAHLEVTDPELDEAANGFLVSRHGRTALQAWGKVIDLSCGRPAGGENQRHSRWVAKLKGYRGLWQGVSGGQDIIALRGDGANRS